VYRHTSLSIAFAFNRICLQNYNFSAHSFYANGSPQTREA
jgi:hypothetical protein